MKITDVVVERFRSRSRTVSDSEGHGHPGSERETVQSLTRIVTDDGAWGVCPGGSQEVADCWPNRATTWTTSTGCSVPAPCG